MKLKVNCPPKTIGTLTKLFCTSGQNLVILAWTGDKLSCGQARDYRTHGRTDTQTNACNDNTRRPKLASGKNWSSPFLHKRDIWGIALQPYITNIYHQLWGFCCLQCFIAPAENHADEECFFNEKWKKAIQFWQWFPSTIYGRFVDHCEIDRKIILAAQTHFCLHKLIGGNICHTSLRVLHPSIKFGAGVYYYWSSVLGCYIFEPKQHSHILKYSLIGWSY